VERDYLAYGKEMKTPEKMAEEYAAMTTNNLFYREPLSNAFLAGYKAAQDQFRSTTGEAGDKLTPTDWISVKDKLPKWHKDVLAYTVFCSFREIKVVRHEPNYGFDFKGIVTHWMPLPAAPEEEE
jgi:hypothetical protein